MLTNMSILSDLIPIIVSHVDPLYTHIVMCISTSFYYAMKRLIITHRNSGVPMLTSRQREVLDDLITSRIDEVPRYMGGTLCILEYLRRIRGSCVTFIGSRTHVYEREVKKFYGHSRYTVVQNWEGLPECTTMISDERILPSYMKINRVNMMYYNGMFTVINGRRDVPPSIFIDDHIDEPVTVYPEIKIHSTVIPTDNDDKVLSIISQIVKRGEGPFLVIVYKRLSKLLSGKSIHDDDLLTIDNKQVIIQVSQDHLYNPLPNVRTVILVNTHSHTWVSRYSRRNFCTINSYHPVIDVHLLVKNRLNIPEYTESLRK